MFTDGCKLMDNFTQLHVSLKNSYPGLSDFLQNPSQKLIEEIGNILPNFLRLLSAFKNF